MVKKNLNAYVEENKEKIKSYYETLSEDSIRLFSDREDNLEKAEREFARLIAVGDAFRLHSGVALKGGGGEYIKKSYQNFDEYLKVLNRLLSYLLVSSGYYAAEMIEEDELLIMSLDNFYLSSGRNLMIFKYQLNSPDISESEILSALSGAIDDSVRIEKEIKERLTILDYQREKF